MTVRPLLLLHGIRGARLGLRGNPRPEIIWELANEDHPQKHLMALRLDESGNAHALDPTNELVAVDLEPDVYGRFLGHHASRVIAPAWDWRKAPDQAVEELELDLSGHSALDVVTHSMGLQMLAELLRSGRLKLEQLRKVVLVAAPFGGSLDILHVLLLGCDRGGNPAEQQYGALVRSFPALYHLLPVPGYGLVHSSENLEPELLDPAVWPQAIFGEKGQYRQRLTGLLARTRSNRDRLDEALRQLAALGERLLILCGVGEPTPLHLQFGASGCDPASVEMGPEGDGRLALGAQSPEGRLPGLFKQVQLKTFGSDAWPMRHGDMLQESIVIEEIDRFLA